MMKKKYYLAYGSNLNVEQMAWRCPDAKVVGSGVISGYRLLFKGSKSGAYLTIEKDPDSIVPVGVWEVSEDDEAMLDHYEGYPNFYYKKQMEIPYCTPSGEVRVCKAFVYIMHEERNCGIPTKFYMSICKKGYKDFGFDTVHLDLAFEDTVKEIEDMADKIQRYLDERDTQQRRA